MWIDVTVDPSDVNALLDLTTELLFDALAVHDAVSDFDLPKVDDFGHHLLVIMHGLREDKVDTYEVDCFATDRYLVTVHAAPSPALEALWSRVAGSPELAQGGVDELLARLADVLTRRLLSVVTAFDDAVDPLIDRALAADTSLLAELTEIRSNISSVRRVVQPQRDVLDELRFSTSPLLTDIGRRRFSDAFDVATRTANGLDAARTALAEILDAYRGAEARRATDATMVLTIYAAIMLPLSLIAGFFGMNFTNLPWVDAGWGWIAIVVIMGVITAVSLGVFVAAGWVRRPSGRSAGATLGRGLIEAARAPAAAWSTSRTGPRRPVRAPVPLR